MHNCKVKKAASDCAATATPPLSCFKDLCFLSVGAAETTSQVDPHMAESFQNTTMCELQ